MLQHGIFNGTNKNLVIAVDSQNSSHYIIMHVLEYQPAANAKLAVVKTQIIERINADEAVLKLHKLGESMLKNQVLLVKLPFVQPSTITLLSSNLKPALTLQLLSHHENYPFYLSDTTSDGSLVIYRVQTPAKSRESLTVSEQESILLNNASSARQLLSEAYLQSLALKYKVQINQLEGSH
jgi:hypothetical protein